jgi:hypothetical protein
MAVPVKKNLHRGEDALFRAREAEDVLRSLPVVCRSDDRSQVRCAECLRIAKPELVECLLSAASAKFRSSRTDMLCASDAAMLGRAVNSHCEK